MENNQNNEEIREPETAVREPDSKKSHGRIPPFIILAVIAIVAALALALTNSVTKEPIKQAKALELAQSFKAVMPAAENMMPEEAELTEEQGNSGVTSLARIYDGDTLLGYCVKASVDGYNGKVSVLLGLNEAGSVIGAQIGDSDFKETSTLGGKWLKEENTAKLLAIDVNQGGALDTIGGASVTSGAVLKAANAAVRAASESFFGKTWEEDPVKNGAAEAADYVLISSDGTSTAVLSEEYAPPKPQVLIGAAPGFNDAPVTVTLTVDSEDVITELTIDASTQAAKGSDPMGLKASEADFAAQFVGHARPVAYGEGIEAISGASLTSNAVIQAINSANSVYVTSNDQGETVLVVNSKKLTGSATVVYDIERGKVTGSKVDVEEKVVEVPGERTIAAGTYTAAAKGFVSDVTVNATIDGEGTITELTIDASSEMADGDDPKGLKAGEEEFTSQFIGKTLPVAYGDGIEAISGATFTSNAVIEALNSIGKEESIVLEPGVYTGSAKGFGGNVTVNVTIDEDSQIAEITIDASSEMADGDDPKGLKAGEEEFASQFIGKTLPVAYGDGIEAISGATFTSNAVIEALNGMTLITENDEEIMTEIASDDAGSVALNDQGAARLTPGVGYDGTVTVTYTVEDGKITAAKFITPGAQQEASEDQGETEDEVLTASAVGFQNPITVSVTFDENSAIKTLTIDALTQMAMGDNPMGLQAGDEAFTSQFIGKTLPVAYGDGIEAIAGATMTSNAVIEALNSITPPAATEEPAAEPEGEVLTASAEGFYAPITVYVTFDENSAIKTLTIDASTQTPSGDDPKGLKAGEEEFTSQFIGKTLPVAYGDGIEAIAGATMTSNAVIEALNSITPPAAVEESVTEPEGEVLSASAEGFYAPITVYVTFDENSAIKTLTIDASTQTPSGDDPKGLKAGEEGFTSQFIGKTLPVAYGDDIEAIAGATMTSNAVIEALNSITPPAAEETAAEGMETKPEGIVLTVEGFHAPLTLNVTLDENNTIQALTIDASQQVPMGDNPMGQQAGEENFTSQFIGKTLPVAYGDGIEAISGATFTSDAVIEALNSLAAPATTEEPAVEGTETEPEGIILTVEGFHAPLTLNVTLDENNTIQALTIDASQQVPMGDNPMGQQAGDEAFISQFIGKTLPVAYGDGIEAISGATFTSNAVIEALNSLAATENTEEPAEKSAEPEGIVLTVEGFHAPLTLNVTLDENNTIQALTIDASQQVAMGDNPMGQQAGEEAFTSQFIGKTLPVTYGDGIEAISGATFTSNAVIEALNNLAATEKAPDNQTETVESDEEKEDLPVGEVQTVTVEGFYGDVIVYVALDANYTIRSLEIDASTQSGEHGQDVADETFTSQFIGKTLPVEYGDDLEAIAGATVTSKAVVKALNSLVPETENKPYVPIETVIQIDEEGTASIEADGVQAVTVQGFVNDITVYVALDENNTIVSLAIDASTQSGDHGQDAGSEAFTGQFIGKTLPVEYGEDLEAIAGATVTSKAVVKALNSLAPDVENKPYVPVETVIQIDEEIATSVEADDVQAITVQGFANDITVYVALDENNTIVSLAIDASTQSGDHGQDAGSEAFTNQFIGKTLPVEYGEDLEAVAGATVTSRAVIKALNSLVPDVENKPYVPDEAVIQIGEESAASVEADDVQTVTVQGFVNDITIYVALDENNTIVSLAIDASSQSGEHGQDAGGEAFTSQFIGKKLPVEYGEDLEAITGATVTSNAVIEALNSLIADDAASAESVAEESIDAKTE